jgi:D-alanyl-D-alanine dipeptidase
MRAAAASLIVGIVLLRAAAAQGLPSQFVYLRDIDPTIAQDIRYAGSNNFVGHPLPGYEAPECLLRDAAARALASVQAALAADGFGLMVYDCYRPTRAVRAMLGWAATGPAGRTDERFFPHVPKEALLAHGYLARRSSHSTGLAVDLTLVATGQSAATGMAAGPCRGPADGSIDMGSSFDCFDPKSATASPDIGAAARQHRMLLVAAMQRRGFVNYSREWWHFGFARDRGPRTAFDFPIGARPAR